MGQIVRKVISGENAFIECTDLFVDIDKIIEYCAKQGIKKENITIRLDGYPDMFLDVNSVEKLKRQLEILISNVGKNDTEIQRFAKIVTSIDRNIRYAHTKRIIRSKHGGATGNLLDGLLKGKCVCIGYAIITKMALNVHGIDAEIVESDMRKSKWTCMECSKIKWNMVQLGYD